MNKEIEKAIEFIKDLMSEKTDDIMYNDKIGRTILTALEAQQADRWIPVTDHLPEWEYVKNIWVTVQRRGYEHRILMRLNWDYHRFQHPNGKAVSELWEILAWRLPEYPKPYKEVNP